MKAEYVKEDFYQEPEFIVRLEEDDELDGEAVGVLEGSVSVEENGETVEEILKLELNKEDDYVSKAILGRYQRHFRVILGEM